MDNSFLRRYFTVYFAHPCYTHNVEQLISVETSVLFVGYECFHVQFDTHYLKISLYVYHKNNCIRTSRLKFGLTIFQKRWRTQIIGIEFPTQNIGTKESIYAFRNLVRIWWNVDNKKIRASGSYKESVLVYAFLLRMVKFYPNLEYF